MPVEIDYAAAVKALLDDQKVTAYEMAKRAGLTQQAILAIVNGDRPNPRAETLRMLLTAAGKSWKWLDTFAAERSAATELEVPATKPKGKRK